MAKQLFKNDELYHIAVDEIYNINNLATPANDNNIKCYLLVKTKELTIVGVIIDIVLLKNKYYIYTNMAIENGNGVEGVVNINTESEVNFRQMLSQPTRLMSIPEDSII